MTTDTEFQMLNLTRMQTDLNANPALNKLLQSDAVKAGVQKMEAHYTKVYGSDYFGGVASMKVTVKPPVKYAFEYETRSNGDNRRSSARFSLRIEGNIPGHGVEVIGFEVTMYPYCCGMRQFNGFSYNFTGGYFDGIEQNLLDQFVSTCLEVYCDILGVGARRAMINFVEASRGRGFGDASDIPEKENPDIYYPLFYQWAKKQKKYHASLMYNSNSGNILHHAEVVF